MTVTLEQIAKEVQGKAPAEQAYIAKDCGMKPARDGLIEFDQPIGFEFDDELSAYIPVLGIVSVDDAEEASEEDLERREEIEDANSESGGGFETMNTSRPYLWYNGGTPVMSHALGYQWIGSPIQGTTGYPINQVRLQNFSRNYSARTGYNTHRSSGHASNVWRWSPRRTYTGTPNIYSFTREVYGDYVDVW